MKIVVHPESWNELKSKLRMKYPELRNADLLFTSDKQEEMMKMVAYKLGKSVKELKEIIQKL
jgi:hypothetical protein